MKPANILFICLSVFLLGTTSGLGQQTLSNTTTLKTDKDKIKAQRHTVMSRFEPELASSEEERLRKKQNRIAETKRKLRILDTLDISDRKRKMLLKDLKYSPFSNRLSKATLVDTKFEDTSNKQEK